LHKIIFIFYKNFFGQLFYVVLFYIFVGINNFYTMLLTDLPPLTADLTVSNRVEILTMLAAESQKLSREEVSTRLRQSIRATPKTWTRILNNTSQPELWQLVVLAAELKALVPALVNNLDDLIRIN